jgi:chemotaxis protein MotD
MSKLSGTSGQLFSVIADNINARGTARSGKGPGAQATGDASFHNLVRTVSNLAKRTLSDQDHEGSVTPAAPRTRAARLAERDELNDETVRERPETAEEPDASHQSATLDQTVTMDVQSRLTRPSIVGQALAAALAMKPPTQTSDGAKGAAPTRAERSSMIRELPGASTASALKADIAESGGRPSIVAAPATTTVPGNAAPAKNMSAASGFETVAANIERAAKVSGRETLREATKVTVVQHETHLPPLQQFTATQQVANAVVAELEGSAAPASSAAPNLASPQSSAPDQPLKVLTISLDPPALGNVTVRIRLVGEAVSVHLAADRKDTSQMLDLQRDSIRELMQSAGYVADVAPVRHGALDGFQAGAGQSQPSLSGQQQSPQAQGALDGSGTSSGQSQDGAKQARQEQQTKQEASHEQDVVPHDRRGAVYL